MNHKSGVLRYHRGKPTPWQKLGYSDALLGRLPREIVAKGADQRNYQYGRLMVHELRNHGIMPPAWPKSTQGFPDALVRAMSRISETGLMRVSKLVPDPLPPDDSLTFTKPHLNRRGFPNPIPTYCDS